MEKLVINALKVQQPDLNAVKEKFFDLSAAVAKLPKAERESYERAEASVTEARRNAAAHEGALQLR